MQKFYVDTSVWRDYFEDRKDNIRPLGEFAFNFLKNCKNKKCTIFFSEAILFELREFKERWNEMFSSFGEILVKVDLSAENANEARFISMQRKLPLNDVFHAIIARDNYCILISRDKHFQELNDIVESRMPEEVIFE